MATRRRARSPRTGDPGNPLRCRDCGHSYDWHSMSLDGHPILCRCRMDEESGFGKWCKFLKDPQCGNFVKRNDSDNAET